jgi:hypothetical protein
VLIITLTLHCEGPLSVRYVVPMTAKVRDAILASAAVVIKARKREVAAHMYEMVGVTTRSATPTAMPPAASGLGSNTIRDYWTSVPARLSLLVTAAAVLEVLSISQLGGLHLGPYPVSTLDTGVLAYAAILPVVILIAVTLVLLLSNQSARRHVIKLNGLLPDDRIIAVALTLDKDAVFRRARRRVEIAFSLQLAILVLLAVVLVAGLAGVILAGVQERLDVAAGSGGSSILGLVAVATLKPHAEIRKALADAQRLELVHEECRVRLDLCSRLRALREQIDCAASVWQTALHHLS